LLLLFIDIVAPNAGAALASPRNGPCHDVLLLINCAPGRMRFILPVP